MKNFDETVSAACFDSLLTSTDAQILTLQLLAHTHQTNNIDLAKLKSGNRIIITIKGGMEM